MSKLVEKVKEGPKARRTRHAKEFKLEAVRLLELGEKSATQLALELRIKPNQLHKWQTELRNKGEPLFFWPGAKPLSEYSEVERLKRELKLVTEERDILNESKERWWGRVSFKRSSLNNSTGLLSSKAPGYL